MRAGAKMLMMANRSKEGRESGYSTPRQNYPDIGYAGMNYGQRNGRGSSETRSEYETEGNYNGLNNRSNYSHNEREYEMEDMKNRFRDRRGREHYNNGRFSPVRSEMDDMEDNYDVENRRRFPRREDGTFAPRSEIDDMESRRRDSRGRFRSEWENMGMHYPMTPYVPPIYEREEGGNMGMNPIGFLAPSGRSEMGNDYHSDAGYQQMDEMRNRNSPMMAGRAFGTEPKLTKEMAEEWMRNLQNEDGTKGPHWTLEQAKQVMAQRGIQCDPLKFWVALNAEYSDRSAVNKKHNVNTIDFYADSAMAAWLEDRDAVSDKLAAYYTHVAKH